MFSLATKVGEMPSDSDSDMEEDDVMRMVVRSRDFLFSTFFFLF